jgi:hypothetical protein
MSYLYGPGRMAWCDSIVSVWSPLIVEHQNHSLLSQNYSLPGGPAANSWWRCGRRRTRASLTVQASAFASACASVASWLPPGPGRPWEIPRFLVPLVTWPISQARTVESWGTGGRSVLRRCSGKENSPAFQCRRRVWVSEAVGGICRPAHHWMRPSRPLDPSIFFFSGTRYWWIFMVTNSQSFRKVRAAHEHQCSWILKIIILWFKRYEN